jgi:hypothetical protein
MPSRSLHRRLDAVEASADARRPLVWLVETTAEADAIEAATGSRPLAWLSDAAPRPRQPADDA